MQSHTPLSIEAMSVRELAARVAGGALTAEAVARHFADRIARLEPQLRAWQHFDPDQALAAARALDAAGVRGPLAGVPVGVKDLLDTADMPTTYGSPIYAGHRPRFDAACVAACRGAGAVIMGKTVTTEFATFQPGPTLNPRAPAGRPHTPGGSSSGSAAAVAAGMVPLAFGTQTAGSIVRPAAYCGVVGYKPTHGLLPLSGVKPLAPSLDTVGVLARSVDDAGYFIGVLAGTDLMTALPPAQGWRVGICRTPMWPDASADARAALTDAARRLEHAGARLNEAVLPPHWDALSQAQIDLMGHEVAAAFAAERRAHPDQFSPAFAALVAQGAAVDGERLQAARRLTERARCESAQVFAGLDVVLAPSAPGEAPAGLASTGAPTFNRLWTLLGLPCVHVPVGTGGSGLPVGVTVIGPRWRDAATLAVADLLHRADRRAEGARDDGTTEANPAPCKRG